MTKEAKGQRVKTFKEFEPLADMTMESKTIVVYFEANTGSFKIFLPEHMTLVLENNYREDARSGYRFHRGIISASTLTEVIEGWKGAVKRFLEIRRTEVRKKVIIFTFKYNSSHRYSSVDESISFIGAPAVHLSYQILYEVGDKLYKIVDGDQMAYHGRTKENVKRDGGAQQIDWTQEREDFFSAMKESLNGLIDKLAQFTESLKQNPDLAIANFGTRNLLAPPVEPAEER